VFYPTTLSQDFFGRDFVSSVESSTYPFLGHVYHPEKPAFNYQPSYMGHLVQTEESIVLMRKHFDAYVK
jgi:hypothetical protein